MPREVFVAGQVLTAAELNVVSDQSVMVFAGTAARGSAIPSPSEGMVTYLEDADEVQVYVTDWEPVGVSPAILQVVSTAKTDTFTTSSTSYVDITGLSVTITPTSATSKILVLVDLKISNTVSLAVNNSGVYAQIVRDSTAIYIGDTAGSRSRASMGDGPGAVVTIENASANFLDSPATTSAVVYKLQIKQGGNAGVAVVNRMGDDSDSVNRGRTASSITVMEVAG